MTLHNSSSRVALVTGGAKGIGAEVCRSLCARGFKVWVADLDLPQAQSLATELRQDGGRAEAIALDVAQPDSVEAAFAHVDAHDQRCDVLVNSAGIAKVFPHTEQFRAEYAKAIPMARYGNTQEIAAAVMYLCSEEASYTTGVALPVDGGFLASGARGL